MRPLFGFLATVPEELREFRRGVAASIAGLGGFAILFPFAQKAVGGVATETNTKLLDRILIKLSSRKTLILKQPLSVSLLERLEKLRNVPETEQAG